MSSNPARRVPRACDQCRARKVRCDGKRSGCSNCDRLSFSCSFQQVAASWNNETQDDMPSRPQRLRTRKACRSCHALKARCSGESPSCRRCIDKEVECVYKSPSTPGTPRSNSSRQYPESQSTELSSQRSPSLSRSIPSYLPFKALIVKSLDLFFEHVHPLPAYAFLHKASLFQRYHAGSVDEWLLLSVIGITSQLCKAMADHQGDGRTFVDTAANSILADIDRPTITKVQALVLIIRYRMAVRNFSSAFMLLSIASRMAFALRLNYENPGLCFLAQESRRRLMWALFMLDSTWSAGLRDFTLCSSDIIYLQLPGTEEDFELDVARETSSLTGESESGRELSILAYYIRIMSIRYHILRQTRHMVASSESPLHISEALARLEDELRTFYSNLPASAIFSDRNIRLRTYSPQLPRYVMLHIWWHQCHCDLFRILTPGFRESIRGVVLQQIDPDYVSYCQAKCLQHAKSIAEIVSTFLDLGTRFPTMDLDIAICSYQSIRIISHSFRINSNKFSLTREVVINVAKLYIRLLNQLYGKESLISSIVTDIEILLAQGFPAVNLQDQLPSSPSSQNGCDDEGISTVASSSQLLSQHSLIRQSGFVDDSFKLSMRSNDDERPASDEIKGHIYPSRVLATRGYISNSNSYSHLNRNSDDQISSDIGGNWEPNNAFQGAWDTFSPSLDPVAQLQADWGAISSLQSDIWPPV